MSKKPPGETPAARLPHRRWPMAPRRHVVPRRLSDGLRPPLSRLGPAEPTADHLDAPADHTWPPAQAGAPGESAPPSTVHPHAHCTLLSTRGVDACGVQCGATPRRPPRPDQQSKLRSPRKCSCCSCGRSRRRGRDCGPGRGHVGVRALRGGGGAVRIRPPPASRLASLASA